MSDLISRSDLFKKLQEKSIVDGVNVISTTFTYKELAYIICNLPTVYDLEEVLAELEVDTVNVDAIIGKHIVNVKMINADRAINIVKAGGTDGKIDTRKNILQ